MVGKGRTVKDQFRATSSRSSSNRQIDNNNKTKTRYYSHKFSFWWILRFVMLSYCKALCVCVCVCRKKKHEMRYKSKRILRQTQIRVCYYNKVIGIAKVRTVDDNVAGKSLLTIHVICLRFNENNNNEVRQRQRRHVSNIIFLFFY